MVTHELVFSLCVTPKSIRRFLIFVLMVGCPPLFSTAADYQDTAMLTTYFPAGRASFTDPGVVGSAALRVLQNAAIGRDYQSVTIGDGSLAPDNTKLFVGSDQITLPNTTTMFVRSSLRVDGCIWLKNTVVDGKRTLGDYTNPALTYFRCRFPFDE